jgi:phosphoglycerate dehydrogenase-like enzyme
MTLGVLGMGRVGRRVGRIASQGFGMRVIFHDIAPVDNELSFECERVTPDRLYRECDILTIHTDMREGNYHLVGREQIALMKRGSVLVNHARGELLDEVAVAEALRSGQLGGAAIDVFDPEPPGENLALLGCPNTLLTPHMAARTSTAIENMSWVVRDVVEVLRGGKAKWPAP